MKDSAAIDFSVYEKRVLGLGFGEINQEDPALKPLRKIIDAVPWILDVIECDFDHDVYMHSLKLQAAAIEMRMCVAEYHKKKNGVPSEAADK